MPNPQDHFLGRHYEAERTAGPFKSFNPTKRYHVAEKQDNALPYGAKGTPSSKAGGRKPKVVYVWRARDNRKGRHAVTLDQDIGDHAGKKGPKPSNSWGQILLGIKRMLVRYPVWDVSYDVALIFTIGSVIWVFNGFFAWLPLASPSTEFSGETDWAGGITAFVGATVFELGSILLMLEAVNENRSDCFGWAVEETLDGFMNIHPAHGCRHSHAQKKTYFKGATASVRESTETSSVDSTKVNRTWSWWPTWYELKSHYFRDIGFLACFSQMIGATIFWIAGITSLPPILNSLSTKGQNGAYWAPQGVGGTGFIVSSALFMLEVQPKWYIPAPGVLGWHIGFWNFIGALGFTLCGALGFGASHPAVEYALALSTFIGSWAFLIGSVIQWFESLDKYPIWVSEKAPRHLVFLERPALLKEGPGDAARLGSPFSEPRTRKTVSRDPVLCKDLVPKLARKHHPPTHRKDHGLNRTGAAVAPRRAQMRLSGGNYFSGDFALGNTVSLARERTKTNHYVEPRKPLNAQEPIRQRPPVSFKGESPHELSHEPYQRQRRTMAWREAAERRILGAGGGAQ
ncbi:hypothetical protein G7046_g7424 [Stylonectria norvegica]|nr:hypothetical protein G7046_g7424 [Stylonectria norvegica]